MYALCIHIACIYIMLHLPSLGLPGEPVYSLLLPPGSKKFPLKPSDSTEYIFSQIPLMPQYVDPSLF